MARAGKCGGRAGRSAVGGGKARNGGRESCWGAVPGTGTGQGEVDAQAARLISGRDSARIGRRERRSSDRAEGHGLGDLSADRSALSRDLQQGGELGHLVLDFDVVLQVVLTHRVRQGRRDVVRDERHNEQETEDRGHRGDLRPSGTPSPRPSTRPHESAASGPSNDGRPGRPMIVQHRHRTYPSRTGTVKIAGVGVLRLVLGRAPSPSGAGPVSGSRLRESYLSAFLPVPGTESGGRTGVANPDRTGAILRR